MREKNVLARRAYMFLWNEIVSLRIRPGEAILEADVCKCLNMSRTPVREALIRLTRENLVVRGTNHRWVVAPITTRMVMEYSELREAIEGMGARLASQNDKNVNVNELRHLATLASSALESGDPNKYFMFNWEFHKSVVEASGNKVLVEAYYPVCCFLSRVDCLTYLSDSYPGDALQDLNIHYSIVDAIANKDAEEAERLARVHTRNTKQRMISLVDSLNFSGIEPLHWVVSSEEANESG